MRARGWGAQSLRVASSPELRKITKTWRVARHAVDCAPYLPAGPGVINLHVTIRMIMWLGFSGQPAIYILAIAGVGTTKRSPQMGLFLKRHEGVDNNKSRGGAIRAKPPRPKTPNPQMPRSRTPAPNTTGRSASARKSVQRTETWAWF